MTNEQVENLKPPKQIGELLKEKGLITETHIRHALLTQKVTKEKLGEVFERLGFVTERDIAVTLSEQSGIPNIDLNEFSPDNNVLKLFNKNTCMNNMFFPVRKTDQTLVVAIHMLGDQKLEQLITRQTGLTPIMFLAERKQIINMINTHYYFLEYPVEKLIQQEVTILSQDVNLVRGMDTLIKHVLHLAVKLRTTDIHIHSREKTLNIAFRIDGVMQSVLAFPESIKRMVTSIKMKAEMDIAELRLPQDGRFSETVLNNQYDFRVSTIVSPEGENMVLRLLPMDSALMGLSQLGFFDEHIRIIQKLFNEPFGIILLTGPTGSGKSTTLYAGIRKLNLLEKNVVTVENPIEYRVPLLRQTQVNEKAGYKFSTAIRHFLRHDPDVILVGEIRDEETASTAISASSTGHLVLSTLHTNSAIGVIPRLKDLGIKPYLLADALTGVVSQRLLRKICNNCKVSYAPKEWEKRYLQDNDLEKLYRGKGCKDCSGSGYLGRTLIYEILTVDKSLSLMIEQEVDMGTMVKKVKGNNFIDIFQVMEQKVKKGITTTKEAIRILGRVR